MPTMWSYSWRMIMLLKGFARNVISRLCCYSHGSVIHVLRSHARFSFIQLALNSRKKRCVIKLKAENRSTWNRKKRVYFCSTKSKVKKFLMTKSSFAATMANHAFHVTFSFFWYQVSRWKSLKVIINMDTILCLNFLENDDMKNVQQIANRNSSQP